MKTETMMPVESFKTKNGIAVVDAEYMALRLIEMDYLESDSIRFKMLEAEFDSLFDEFSDEEKGKIFFIYHGLMSLEPGKRKPFQAAVLGRVYGVLTKNEKGDQDGDTGINRQGSKTLNDS